MTHSFNLHYLPDIPARRKDEVNVPHRIIRLSIEVILILGADIRLPALPRVNIDIQVSIRPFVDRAIPTVTALEDQEHLVTGVREIPYTNSILQLSGQIAIDAASVPCQ
jgi:hypothetical protein